MTFNLTESPWIDAGRQYSIRVSETRNEKEFFMNTQTYDETKRYPGPVDAH